MDYSKVRQIIENEFKDKFTSYNYVTAKNTDGTTATNRVKTPKLIDIPCKLSFLNYDSPTQGQVDTNLILLNPKIFLSLDYNIQAGDYLEVSCIGQDGSVLQVYKGIAGMPNVYITHKEVLFSMKANA